MQELLQTARSAAQAAAEVHRKHAGNVGVEQAEEKGRADFVSGVDIEAQRVALEIIRKRHPDHVIMAEETDPADGAQGATLGDLAGGSPIWVVDPLDGTANFLNGHPLHCSSVGVVIDGRLTVGAVACAPLGQEWWAARGCGAYRNGEPIRVSASPDLSVSLIGTGFPFKAIHLLDGYLSGLGTVIRNSAGVRRGGSAALDLCHVAEGTLTAFWELRLSPWDWAAGLAILEEAGGVAGRIEGGEIDPLVGGSILAAGTGTQMELLREWVRV